MDELIAHDGSRSDFLKACLVKLGLQVTQDVIPSLSPLYLSAADPDAIPPFATSLHLTKEGYLKDSHDTFRVQRQSGTFNMQELTEALPDSSNEGILDYKDIVKRLVICDDIPLPKSTPCFNHHAFYSNLGYYQSRSREGASSFGSLLIYAEVITSTNSILEE